jgi:hypothetical protein
MIGILFVTIMTVSFWWVLRQTAWNVWAPVGWRLSLIGLEFFFAIAYVTGAQETDPFIFRVGWSLLNLSVLAAFAYFFDRKAV